MTVKEWEKEHVWEPHPYDIIAGDCKVPLDVMDEYDDCEIKKEERIDGWYYLYV